jgi:hypothetical protein
MGFACSTDNNAHCRDYDGASPSQGSLKTEGYQMITQRAMKVCLLAMLGGAAMVGDVQHATGNVLRWNLQNVTFNDGGTATGFFALDTAPESQPADFDVKVTGGKYPSFEYSPQSSASFRTSATFTPGNNLVALPPVGPRVSFGTLH